MIPGIYNPSTIGSKATCRGGQNIVQLDRLIQNMSPNLRNQANSPNIKHTINNSVSLPPKDNYDNPFIEKERSYSPLPSSGIEKSNLFFGFCVLCVFALLGRDDIYKTTPHSPARVSYNRTYNPITNPIPNVNQNPYINRHINELIQRYNQN